LMSQDGAYAELVKLQDVLRSDVEENID